MSMHAAVWIDHREARIFHFGPEEVDGVDVIAPAHQLHRKHPRGPAGVKNHPDDEKRFLHDVVSVLADDEEILIVGPAHAKLDLLRYVHDHVPKLSARIVGIETVDHPTDGQLVAYAKSYFKRGDKIRQATI